MSYWTHVCGIVRLDTAPNYNSKPQIKDFEIYFDDIPIGSEEGLSFELNKVKRIGWTEYQILIYGDLRDYTDLDYIIEWFKNFLNKLSKNCMIRIASLSAYDGFKTTKTYGIGSMP